MVRVIAFRGEAESETLATVEDATLTAGGYDRADLAILRDGNGDPIARLRHDGWSDHATGQVWDDITIVAEG